MSNLLSGLFQI